MKNELNISDYARLKNVTRATIYAWIKEPGRLNHKKVGGATFITLTDEEKIEYKNQNKED